MTIKKIIDKLRSDGVRVQYRKRTDGGYYITSINGAKYKGKAGNRLARSLLGENLTSKQITQRSKSAHKWEVKRGKLKEAGKATYSRYGTKVPRELRSLVTKVNKALRGTKQKTRISLRKIKAALRRGESVSSITYRLRETLHHAKGRPYSKEIDYICSALSYYGLEDLSNRIFALRELLTSADAKYIRDLIYEYRDKPMEMKEHITDYLDSQEHLKM